MDDSQRRQPGSWLRALLMMMALHLTDGQVLPTLGSGFGRLPGTGANLGAAGLPQAPALPQLPRPPGLPRAPTLPVHSGINQFQVLPGLPTSQGPVPRPPVQAQRPVVPRPARLPTLGGGANIQPPPAGAPSLQRPSLPQVPTNGLGVMQRALNQINQQVTALRNRLSPVDNRGASGVSLLQFQTSPAVISEGVRSLRNIQETARRISQGQQPAVSELIYPPAILSILNGASALPAGANGQTPQRIGCTNPILSCSPSVYRTMDGTCNNRAQTGWGRARSPLIRLHPNTYQDGVLWPRVNGADGSPLPSARLVSQRSLTVAENRPSQQLTLAVMQWGQFIDHDITHVPVQRPEGQRARDCCTGNIAQDQLRRIPECFPIEVAANDPFYSRHRVRCLNFLRSIPALGCRNEPAQQLNQITHWVDGSNVYGSSDEELSHLREGSSRRMRMSQGKRLPRIPHGAEGCTENAGNGICYRAGDTRVNEQISLTVMHNIWALMHNIIADELLRLNPRASQEDIFQEARAINVALMQHITYSEWLPIVLGQAAVRHLGLNQPGSYNPAIHPGIINEFSTAAFRFGHSLIAGAVQLGRGRSVRLSDVFFNPGSRLEQSGTMREIARSLFQQPSQAMDTTFTVEVVGRLFRGTRQFGLDLLALNVQRGRDHGTASYTQMRAQLARACPSLGAPITSWQQLSRVMPQAQVQRLQSVYRAVSDIDLFIGGVHESRAPGALISPIFRCLLAEQFTRLKYGDRFFYNHQASMFSAGQLAELSRATLSSVMCQVIPELGSVQQNAFLRAGRTSACRSMRRLNLQPWSNALPRR